MEYILLRIAPQYCTKIIHVLHKLKKDIVKVTKPSISQKASSTHTSSKSGDIDVQQIHSNDNLGDLFTKAF